MATDHKYYRTLIVVEVLGNEPGEFANFADLERAVNTGHFSGDVKIVDVTEVTQEQMHQLLEMQRSSPDFLDPEED